MFPVSDIGAVVGTKAPPSMHRERCLRIPTKIQRRRRNCTEGSASSMRLREFSFSDFLSTRPKRGGGYGCSSPHHAGNLYVPPFSMGKTGENRRDRTTPSRQKQEKSPTLPDREIVQSNEANWKGKVSRWRTEAKRKKDRERKKREKRRKKERPIATIIFEFLCDGPGR